MTKLIPADLTQVPYGFKWGPLEVTRCCSDDKKGWVVVAATSKKHDCEIYCTKTGKIRFYVDGVEWKNPQEEE